MRIVDFGLARNSISPRHPGAHYPFPTYSSAPEMRLRRLCSPASDVFQVGVFILEVAGGVPARELMLECQGGCDKKSGCSFFSEELYGSYLANLPNRVAASIANAELRAIALDCLRGDPADRPSIAEVVVRLTALEKKCQ